VAGSYRRRSVRGRAGVAPRSRPAASGPCRSDLVPLLPARPASRRVRQSILGSRKCCMTPKDRAVVTTACSPSCHRHDVTAAQHRVWRWEPQLALRSGMQHMHDCTARHCYSLLPWSAHHRIWPMLPSRSAGPGAHRQQQAVRPVPGREGHLRVRDRQVLARRPQEALQAVHGAYRPQFEVTASDHYSQLVPALLCSGSSFDRHSTTLR